MKIAVLSDTHNAAFDTQEVLKAVAAEGIDTVIHCGDMCAPHIAELFQDFTLYHAWGNNDIDTVGLQLAVRECMPGSQSGHWVKCVFDGKIIGAVHDMYDRAFASMLDSGFFDYIFVGHTHRKMDEMMGKTRVINPGAIGGAHRGKRGYVILDTADGEVTDVVLE